jgi:hypothetical protein
LAELKLQLMGGPDGRLEAIKRHQNTGRMARERFDAVWEAERRGQPEAGLAKLNQSEHLCREQPVALFIVPGGHKTLMKVRMMLLDQARAKRRRQALIKLAVDVLSPFIVVGLFWVWSNFWG